jgi:hypothetical protein
MQLIRGYFGEYIRSLIKGLFKGEICPFGFLSHGKEDRLDGGFISAVEEIFFNVSEKVTGNCYASP